jgi:hypothetical protein
MSDEKTQEVEVEVGDEKTPSLTEQFKIYIQKRYQTILGTRISRESAWLLYKQSVHASANFVLNLPKESQRLSLAGVGTWEIIQAKARTPEEEKLGFNPRFRFYPSSKIQKNVEIFYGLEQGEIRFEEPQAPAPKKEAAKPAPKKEAAKPAPKVAPKVASDEIDLEGVDEEL